MLDDTNISVDQIMTNLSQSPKFNEWKQKMHQIDVESRESRAERFAFLSTLVPFDMENVDLIESRKAYIEIKLKHASMLQDQERNLYQQIMDAQKSGDRLKIEYQQTFLTLSSLCDQVLGTETDFTQLNLPNLLESLDLVASKTAHEIDHGQWTNLARELAALSKRLDL